MTYWARVRRHHRRRRRWQGLIQVALLIGGTFTLAIICFFTGHADDHPNLRSSSSRSLLQASDASPTDFAEEVNVTVQKAAPLFPPSIFTEYQLRYQGAVIFYFLGMIYMFVALAIVCDEFFVPSLDVIIEKLQISEDVAGATFMAAGGSAPELFTSVIGVFISFDDVGIGTIVGSAVFNILFVIAMCVLFSKTVLDLTWWPIFRDVTFYSVALILLVLFFMDSYIYWYEALCLFTIYILYCTFMKVNEPVEKFVKRHLYKNKVTRVCSTDQLVPNHQAAAQSLHALPAAALPILPGMARRASVAPVIHGGTKFRQGLLQLMIHTIDPLHDGKVDEKATQLHAIASLKVLLDSNKPENGRVETYRADGLSADTRPDTVSGRSSQGTEVTHVDSMMSSDVTSQGAPQTNGDVAADNNSLANNVSYGARAIRRISYKAAQNGENNMLAALGEFDPDAMTPVVSTIDPTEDDDEPKPINLSWPDTMRKRIIYVIVAPLIFPLWITLPDARSPRGKRFFFVTFIGSILWIAIFSYFMVWWANVLGETIKIPPEVMGLTVLAAGTSVPDLITSVIVARKGFGDMAVSSSIGSNIFDVCCGLPIPWLLYAFGQLVMNFVNGKENPWTVNPIQVSSGGMACSIMLLFSMLMFVLASIICSRWKMNKGLGISMFILYFVFVGVSLSFEYDIIVCPV